MNRPVHGGNLAWGAELAGCSPAAILDFSASINPLGPPEGAIAAIHQHLEGIRFYPDPSYARLCSVLAAEHNLSPHWLIPGNGVAELLTWAGRDLAQVGETYLLVPAFQDYQRALTAFGAKVVSYPLSFPDCFLPSFPPTGRGDRGLLLNNPHNPTGKLWRVEEILPLLEQFALVVVDEAFMDFLPPETQQSLIPWVQEYENLVILRSLTKFYSLPGLRLGYGIGHPDRLQRWQKWRDPWPVNALAAAVGAVVVTDRVFQERTWHWLQGAREDFYQQLQSLSQFKPLWGSANFLLVETSVSGEQLQGGLLRSDGILIRDCLSFPELGDRFFRVAVRSASDNHRLVTACTQILASVRN